MGEETRHRYGGQAVIEGVLIRGPRKVAVAVRRPDREVVVRDRVYVAWGERWPVLKWPFVRGVVTVAESLSMGLEALAFSAAQASGEDESLGRREMAATMIGAALLAVAVFVLLPTWAVHFARTFVASDVQLNLLEGLLRVLMLVAYVVAISFLPDVRRVLQYHGAEHMAIHALEAGLPLTVENVRRQPTAHPRCGTSFLIFLALASVFLFAFFGWPGLWERFLIRLALLPAVAAVSYEFIRLSARAPGLLAPLALPGLWMQAVTTRPPDEDQIEVAIRALSASMEGQGVASGA